MGNQVKHEFLNIFNLLLAGYRVKTPTDWKKVPGGKRNWDNLVASIANVQPQVKKEYGAIKKWSREIFIKLAADKLKLSVTPELIHEAADAYWITLTQKTRVFPGALKLFHTIAAHHRPIYLITSSDARLNMQPNGQFIYDPAYSEALKRQRIELLREKGLDFRLVSIGDPEDKPSLEFFTKGIKMAEKDLHTKINLNQCVMVGDSYTGDLETPHKKLNFGLVILFNKDLTTTKLESGNYISTGNLAKIPPYLK